MMRYLFQLIPFLLLMLTGCESAGKGSSSFGSQIEYRAGREEIDARVETDGTYFSTRLEIEGRQNQKMEVRVIGDNGKLLGFKYVVPRYENSVWEKFEVFVPMERLEGMRPEMGVDLYVVAPDDLSHYVGAARSDKAGLKSPAVSWKWAEYRDGATLANGERGMQIKMQLDVDGHAGETVKTFAVVSDLELREIGAGEGGPIRIAGPTLSPKWDRTHYDEIIFEVPYSRLKKIPPNLRVKITPSVEIGGRLTLGNMHFSSWAGGTTEDVKQAVTGEANRYRDEADRLGRQIEALQREAGK